jgi:hypothetical protein
MSHSITSEVVKWLIVALIGWSVLITVGQTNKPRKPLEPAVVVLAVVLGAAEIVGIVLLWGTSS